MSDFNIKEVNGKIICIDDFAGINTEDKLYEYSSGGSTIQFDYTASEDCYVSLNTFDETVILIDNKKIFHNGTPGTMYHALVPLKSGQNIKFDRAMAWWTVIIYGLKY